MKITLINSATSRRQKPDFPPPAIAYLGATAHQAGHEVLLVDGGLRVISQIVQDVRQVSPDVIGVTCWTIDRHLVWELCAALKEAVPDNDSTMYYTGERSLRELKWLRDHLTKGLTKNENSFRAYTRCFSRKAYYAFLAFQKLGKWKKVLTGKLSRLYNLQEAAFDGACGYC